MDKTSPRGRVSGRITAPASKSYAQRAIAAALLSERVSTITNMAACDDTAAALSVAEALGAEVDGEGSTYRIKGGLDPRSTQLNIGESGLAARLFTPIAALSQYTITINGEGSILRRPIGMMEEPLEALGVEVNTNGGYLPITVTGEIKGGEITVDGSGSSQFVTGLLMALPMASGDTVVKVENLKSRPYVDMTIGLAEEFGVEIEHNDYEEFYVRGGQSYTATTYNVEGDWSGASCLLVAGATAGEITVDNLNPLSLQADTAIIDALVRAGAEITSTENTVTVRRGELAAFEFDATECPDLFPALAALAASCEGTTTLYGTERLAFKESNRAESIADIFGTMGIKVDLGEKNVMRITGGAIKSAVVSSHNDHRIAMAAAVAGLGSDSEVVIKDAEAVGKSYPEFWDDLEKIRIPE